MLPLLKRIALNGLLTAGVLAAVGFAFGELAELFLVARAPSRATPVELSATPPVDPMTEQLQARLPVMMAVWGFLFIATGEVGLHWWRSRKAKRTPAAEPQQDPTELLLKQILLDAEAKSAPSPSSASAENTPVAS